MRVTFYGYNTFVVRSDDKKIVIDPGAELYFFRFLKSNLPRSEYNDVTHIFVTHADPDHYWHIDRVQEISNAFIVCNKTLIRKKNERTLMLDPRKRGLSFSTPVQKVHTVSPGEKISIDTMNVTGIKTNHGPLMVRIGPFLKTFYPGPNKRIGWGSIGFSIQVDDKTIVNLGDTVLFKEEWNVIKNPDILMIPIGGESLHNTMNETEALMAVKRIKPKMVIPCHYNCPGLFKKSVNPADEGFFKKEVEKMGVTCIILRYAESFVF